MNMTPPPFFSPILPTHTQDTGLCADFHPGGQVVVVGLLTGR